MLCLPAASAFAESEEREVLTSGSFSYANLKITVGRGSYAAEYCKANGLNYTYPDINDWLKD